MVRRDRKRCAHLLPRAGSSTAPARIELIRVSELRKYIRRTLAIAQINLL
jgi:hypothetical protein